MNDVPRDGETMGEVVMRGNIVMAGYFDDPQATATAFRGGWFHSGDLAVWHPDGNVELRDRGKDIIISGGENISSIEVEQAVVAHPAVLECAVVAIPHSHWGERPKAFVTLNEGMTATADEIVAFVRDRLAHYKCPGRRRVRPAAQDLDRQGAEVRAAREGMGRTGEPDRRGLDSGLRPALPSFEMATVTREHVLVRLEPPAARITLNRPEKRNALSLALMTELIAALEELGAAPEVRAIVIEGAGPGVLGRARPRGDGRS